MHPKPHSKNRLAEHIMSYLKTNRTLIKTCHVAQEDSESSADSGDFWPFLPYSLNKKRRWEMEIGVELMERLMEADKEVIVVERVRLGPYDYARHYESTLSGQFAVKSVSWLSENRYFEQISVKSIHGQPIDHFLDITDKPVIAYHFLETPRNYMELFEKQCISKKSDDWPYTNGWQRIRRRKNLLKSLKFEKFEIEEDSEDVEDSGDSGDSEDRKIGKCYNLAEHVFIKKK